MVTKNIILIHQYLDKVAVLKDLEKYVEGLFIYYLLLITLYHFNYN